MEAGSLPAELPSLPPELIAHIITLTLSSPPSPFDTHSLPAFQARSSTLRCLSLVNSEFRETAQRLLESEVYVLHRLTAESLYRTLEGRREGRVRTLALGGKFSTFDSGDVAKLLLSRDWSGVRRLELSGVDIDLAYLSRFPHLTSLSLSHTTLLPTSSLLPPLHHLTLNDLLAPSTFYLSLPPTLSSLWIKRLSTPSETPSPVPTLLRHYGPSLRSLALSWTDSDLAGTLFPLLRNCERLEELRIPISHLGDVVRHLPRTVRTLWLDCFLADYATVEVWEKLEGAVRWGVRRVVLPTFAGERDRWRRYRVPLSEGVGEVLRKCERGGAVVEWEGEGWLL